MFVYTVTYKVENDIAEKWIRWQKEFHINKVINTGCFYTHRQYQLLKPDDDEGVTFIIQFLTETRYEYDQYILNYAGKLKIETAEKWGNRYMEFSTLMKEIK